MKLTDTAEPVAADFRRPPDHAVSRRNGAIGHFREDGGTWESCRERVRACLVGGESGCRFPCSAMEQSMLEVGWEHIGQGVVVLLSLVAAGQWIAWILGIGRFQKRSAQSGWFVQDFASTISADFRHILASALVVLFGMALIVGIALPDRYPDAMQPVMNSFPGLLGAVIGFYFGEKQGREASARGPIGLVAAPGEVTPPSPPSPDEGETEDGQGEATEASGDESSPRQ